MKFSDKYKPLFAKPYAREKVQSEDFKNLSQEDQDYWISIDGITDFVITGGRGSGKSIVVEVDAHFRASKFNHKTYYTRYTNESLETSVIPDFEKVLELVPLECEFQSNKIKYKKDNSYKKGGLIQFKGLKKGSKAQTAGGKGLSSFNCQVIEEAEEHPSFKEFDKMRLSLRRSDLPNYSILLLNPTTITHWIYQKFFKEKKVRAGTNAIIGTTCYIHTSYLDVAKEHHTIENWNSYEKGRKAHEYYLSLSEDEKETADLEIIELYKWYEFTVLGGWLEKAEGTIINNWEFGEFDESLPYGFGQDYGGKDPSTLVKVAIDKKKQLLYVDECFYLSNLDINQLFELNFKFAGAESPIVADYAGETIITSLRNMLSDENEQLYIMKCKKGAGSIIEGIKKMQGYKIIVTPNSRNVETEFNNYVWLDKDLPIDKFNHLVDSIRYILGYLDRG